MRKFILALWLLLFYSFTAKSQWSALSDINNLVSNTSYDQMNPEIILDGAGGYIVAWTEKNPSDHNVWAQRLSSTGAPLWGVNGVAVCTTTDHQMLGGLISDGAGGAIIVWEDSTGTGGGGSHGMNDLYAQRLSSAGVKMWASAGVAICTANELQSNVNIISDNSNGAIITWHDYRNNGYLGSDIYAQRINSSGVIQWTLDGVVVCGATNPQVKPRICADGSGGAYITWEDYRLFSQSEIYVQRINSSGTALFTADGVNACAAANDQMFPEIISDGTGGAFLSWYDKRTNGNLGVGDLYGQRINSTGSILWGSSGLSLCNATGDQFASFSNLTCMLLDGSGGFYYVWNDLRNGSHNIYIQRYNGSGTGLWTANGVAVNISTNNELYPSVVRDGNGGVYVTWDRYGSGAIDIYAQRLDGNGNALWVANGIPVGNATNSQYNNQLVTKGDGTAIVVFNDKRNNVDFNIYAQQIIPTGTCLQPTVTATATTTNLCLGSNVTLTAGGASTYVWTNFGSGNTLMVSPSTATTYTVTGTAADGCSATTTLSINVVNPPTVQISSTTTSVCPNSSATLTASGANTYAWSNGATGATLTVLPTTSSNYTVTGTSSNGCTATSSVSITMNTSPVITVTPNVSTVCLGSSATITATGGVSYVWNTGATTAALTASPIVTTTYTVTGTGANGCTATATKTMNVNNLPNIVITPSNASICAGSSITLTASGAGSYTWTGLGTGASKTVSPTATTIYTITGTSGTGCSNTTTKTLTVNALPTITITPASPSICSGQLVSLQAGGGNSYVWSNNSSSNPTQSVSPSVTTTYTVTGTASTGCSNTASVMVNVNTPPTVSISTSASSVCAGGTATLTASSAGSSFQWTNLGSNAIQVVSPLVTTTYTVTATNSSGCTATATVTISVLTGSSVSISPTSPSICHGSNVTLTPTGASTYVWTNLSGGPTQVVSPLTNTTYTVTGTSSNGCVSTATVTVTVKTLPSVSLTSSANTVCSGSSVTLTAGGASTYVWSNSSTAVSQTLTPTVTTTYTVQGTSATGCSATSSVTIVVNNNCNSVLTINCLVQGYYIGNGTMTPALFNEGQSSNPLACDSITILLHSPTLPYNVIHSQKVAMDIYGHANYSLPSSTIGNSYFISIQFRNAVEIWSANPVLINGNLTYNFTNAASKAFGDNQVLVDPVLNLYATYSGDINHDQAVDTFDYLLLDPDVYNGNGGYLDTDLNGDGAVDTFDNLILAPNVFDGIGAAGP